jgi:hypothetical protein
MFQVEINSKTKFRKKLKLKNKGGRSLSSFGDHVRRLCNVRSETNPDGTEKGVFFSLQ